MRGTRFFERNSMKAFHEGKGFAEHLKRPALLWIETERISPLASLRSSVISVAKQSPRINYRAQICFFNYIHDDATRQKSRMSTRARALHLLSVLPTKPAYFQQASMPLDCPKELCSDVPTHTGLTNLICCAYSRWYQLNSTLLSPIRCWWRNLWDRV